MKIAVLGIAAVLLLAGCSSQPGAAAPSAADTVPASPSPTQTVTPSATASVTTQPLGKGTIDDATLDQAFLSGARKMVPSSIDDATLISMGRGICTDLAAGVSAQAALDKVKAHGLSQNDALILLVAAKTVYCSTVK
ncbi:DUF732 domain-containing protein [Arthrobacter sp. SAFR-044]|uniref:DUF732 domain-containing protein n=1 Tax=Arthrobacter sp. SAFR-044 TaxID=3387278 RepID=UPI003F7BC931